ncbi:hypothetical protein HMPREF0813_01156 [Streptococcus anginosus F0211]|uniref:Uncharacterized protein n=1 Tax=Streptococcus anginosus F0211 TaxID=706437 RepID=E6J1N0_STRAP|nr:hypothetical protein HMPREF0813_01156 [Streptococcus anginosus F0211]
MCHYSPPIFLLYYDTALLLFYQAIFLTKTFPNCFFIINFQKSQSHTNL